MFSRLRTSTRVVLIAGVVIAAFLITPAFATSGSVDFDDHWLAAGCAPSATARMVTTPLGPAVELRANARRAELHCNVDADAYHNWIQLWAEDGTSAGSVSVTMYRQDVISGVLAAPEALISATTVDATGPQIVEVYDDFGRVGDLQEYRYLYFLTISIERSDTTAGPLRVYNTSLRDVL